MAGHLISNHRGTFLVAIAAAGWWLAVTPSIANEMTTPRDATAEAPLESGLPVGEYVPQFYSRVVTGPMMNRSVCFVCRNGGRPVVMVLMRKVSPEARPLLRNIDRLVDLHRTSGLRSFGVMLSDDPFRSISAVQTFAFNAKIDMPLTVGTQAVGEASCQSVHPDAAVTVVLYRQRRVVARYAFREDELTVARFRDVIERVRLLAESPEVAAHDPEGDVGSE